MRRHVTACIGIKTPVPAPCRPQVRIDGNDLATIPEAELRRLISWVPQEPPLFGNITIAENIAYGIDATDEEIIAAAREANCHGFISALPLGYATRLGVRPRQLASHPWTVT